MDPQIKGFVIITLPPPDDPSQGKTITAFTLSDPPEFQFPQQRRHHHQQQPLGSTPPVQSQTLLRSTSLRSRRRIRLFGFLSISLFALLIWAFLFSNTPFKLTRKSDEQSQLSSIIFPLYRKSGTSVDGFIHRDADLKLGRFVKRSVVGSRDKSRNRKNVDMGPSSAINSSTIFPVKGNINPDGLYYTSVFVGNPPKPYYLDMDTGSDLTWIQCDAPCTSCAKGPHPFYKPSKSNLVSTKDSLCLEVQANQNDGGCQSCRQCDYEIEYADQSSSMGVLARDQLLFMLANGTLTKSDFVFGCAYDQQGQLLVSPAKTDGLLGLSKSTVSFPSQLASKGLISNILGHCITAETNGDGYMFLGNNFIPRRGMTWVPMLDSPINFYETEVKKISIGGKQLSAGGVGKTGLRVIFDTGSSFTYFAKEAYTSLISSLKELGLESFVQDESDTTMPVCWTAKFPTRSVRDVQQFFKPLTLHFESRWWARPMTLVIPPEDYLIISNKGNICLGILDRSEVDDGSTNILGDISLRGRLIVYDNEKQKIGWAQSDCVKPPSLKAFPIF